MENIFHNLIAAEIILNNLILDLQMSSENSFVDLIPNGDYFTLKYEFIGPNIIESFKKTSKVFVSISPYIITIINIWIGYWKLWYLQNFSVSYTRRFINLKLNFPQFGRNITYMFLPSQMIDENHKISFWNIH